MLPYWLLFGLFAFGAVVNRRKPAVAGHGEHAVRTGSLGLVLAMVIIALMIGLRFEVGADWDAYVEIFRRASVLDLGRALSFGDPAYQAVNWLAGQLGARIWLVNLICGGIFSWGLYRFVSVQPEPWLAALIAVPYLVVVVAMGYTRQAVALGVLMAGIASLSRGGSILRFAVFATMAALFHRTALAVLPLVMFRSRGNLLYNLAVGGAALAGLYFLLLEDSVGSFVRNYIEFRYQSQGAWIRVIMSLVPAAVFFLFGHRLSFGSEDREVWRNFSVAAVAAAVAMFLVPSSTAVDRLALYLMPLQVAVLSRLPGTVFSVQLGRLLVLVYSALVLFVWLNFAAHADYWLPYEVYPFDEPGTRAR